MYHVVDYAKQLAAMKRDTETRANIRQAVSDIELAAQGKMPSQSLTRSLAIVLLEVHKEVSRAADDLEYIRVGVRALLRGLANEHAEWPPRGR